MGKAPVSMETVNIKALVIHMEWLRAWWEKYGPGISILNKKSAGAVHDHFIDGVCAARSVGRQFGIEPVRYLTENYPWEGDYLERQAHARIGVKP